MDIEREAYDKRKAETGGTRLQAALSKEKTLLNEAGLQEKELRAMFAAKNRGRCNGAAHEMSQMSVARGVEKLQQCGLTNVMVGRALERAFVWLTGRTFSSATHDGGKCVVIRRGPWVINSVG